MRGLIIRSPWIDYILEGRKTWEIRSKTTSVRGRIALIKGGSGHVVGTATLSNCLGPFTFDDLPAHQDKHCVPDGPLAEFRAKYKNRAFAYELNNVAKISKPVPYKHPSGAVIWVNLGDIKLPHTG